jgi:hypothetical protein
MAFLAAGYAAGSFALAGHGCCQRCGSSCQTCQLVECTVYVPVTVMETRARSRVIYKTEQREETYTVFKRVPKTQKFTKERCYLDDEVRTQTITEKKCHRVTNPVIRMEHVHVYEPQIREIVPPGSCTDCDKVTTEEPCTCTVMVKRPDVRTRTCEQPDVVFSETKRQIDYCVKVPKKQTIPCAEETVFELVPVEKKRTVEVCVPEILKEAIEVPVQKMMAKKILCCKTCCGKLHH